MTREEIEKAAEEWKFWQVASVDFAVEMVRRHNKELTKIAETHRGHKKNVEYCWNMIANEIRAAAPK